MNNKLIINFCEKCVFYAFIFLIPLQTRKIFYIFSEGDFNEWLSVFLYATDILVLLLFIFWCCSYRYQVTALPGNGGGGAKLTGADYFLFAFLVWSGISVFLAANFYLGVFRWIKLAEMIFVFFYVRQFLAQYQKSGLISIVWIWIFSAFTQSIIAVAQFFKQSDLGLRIFHESPISALIDGVAKIDIDGLKIVRAYGLFPHPNILAAFLGIAILGCLFLCRGLNPLHSKFKNYILWLMTAVIFTGLFLTFSRSAIALIIVLSFSFLIFSYFSSAEFNQRKEIGKLALFVILCLTILFLLLQPLLINRFAVDIGDQAVNLRIFYNKVALDFIKKSPIFGVGIGNFVSLFQVSSPRLVGLGPTSFPEADASHRYGAGKFQVSSSWQYQPVHNLYLLIAAETGIFGLVLFLGFIVFLLRAIFQVSSPRLVGLGPTSFKFQVLGFIFYFLFLGFIDHYFWTLQQGMLMMWVVFGAVESTLTQKFNS